MVDLRDAGEEGSHSTTLPPPFSLLSYFWLSYIWFKTSFIIYYFYFVESQHSKHRLVFNNSAHKGNQELGTEIRCSKQLIAVWWNNVILQCFTGHVLRVSSFEWFQRNGITQAASPRMLRCQERRLELEVSVWGHFLGNADLPKVFVIHTFYNNKTSEGNISWMGN